VNATIRTPVATNDFAFVTQRRNHEHGADMAVLSPDHTYRYVLERNWGPGPAVCWIGLNPSTADAFTDDPTARRIRDFTKKFAPGAGGFILTNLYALRATDPRQLRTHNDPGGPYNRTHLLSVVHAAHDARQLVIAAWGTQGGRDGHGDRVAAVLNMAGIKLHCLGTNKDGSPKHPLYVKGDTPLVPYTPVLADKPGAVKTR
jgi:hypothetical protein